MITILICSLRSELDTPSFIRFKCRFLIASFIGAIRTFFKNPFKSERGWKGRRGIIEFIMCQWCFYVYTQELDEGEYGVDGEHCPCCGSKNCLEQVPFNEGAARDE